MKDDLPTIRRTSNDLWAEIEPLPWGGESVWNQRGDRRCRLGRSSTGYSVRSGPVPMEALPKEYGSGSMARRRFQQWERDLREGVGELLERYDDIQGIKGKWQSLDLNFV